MIDNDTRWDGWPAGAVWGDSVGKAEFVTPKEYNGRRQRVWS